MDFYANRSFAFVIKSYVTQNPRVPAGLEQVRELTLKMCCSHRLHGSYDGQGAVVLRPLLHSSTCREGCKELPRCSPRIAAPEAAESSNTRLHLLHEYRPGKPRLSAASPQVVTRSANRDMQHKSSPIGARGSAPLPSDLPCGSSGGRARCPARHLARAGAPESEIPPGAAFLLVCAAREGCP